MRAVVELLEAQAPVRAVAAQEVYDLLALVVRGTHVLFHPLILTYGGPRRGGVPRAGQTLVHPATGQRLTFVRTAAQTAGALLELESVLPPGSPRPPLHLHPRQEERFIPLEGVLRGWLGRRRVEVRPGAALVVPPGVPHTLGGEGRLRWEFRPALRTAELLEAVVGVAAQHGALVRGVPRPLPLAAVLHGFQTEIRLALVPPAVQRVALAALAALWEQRRGRP